VFAIYQILVLIIGTEVLNKKTTFENPLKSDFLHIYESTGKF
jgi:hypothetical protein